jgi:molecular chaperone DnaK (HSP70)
MPRAKPQIEVSFSLDASGILTVSASEKSSNSSAKITISSKGVNGLIFNSIPISQIYLDRLSESEIKKMLHLAEKYEEEDRVARETLEWRNGLEAYAFNVKSKIEEPEVWNVLWNVLLGGVGLKLFFFFRLRAY